MTPKPSPERGNRRGHWNFIHDNYPGLQLPQPLAEELPVENAEASLRHLLTRANPEGRLLSAWHHIEYGLNQSVDMGPDLRRKYIGDAADLLGGIAANHGLGFTGNRNSTLYTQALTTSAYLPLFVKRSVGERITTDDCEDTYATLVAILDDMQELPSLASSYHVSLFPETIALAASARSRQPELLLYLSSPREESSPKQHMNHDSYFIKNGCKLPIQVKLIETEKEYSDPTVVYVDSIAHHALIRAGIVHDTDELLIGEPSQIIAELMSDELKGLIDDQERETLNYVTRSIVARYRYAPDSPVAA